MRSTHTFNVRIPSFCYRKSPIVFIGVSFIIFIFLSTPLPAQELDEKLQIFMERNGDITSVTTTTASLQKQSEYLKILLLAPIEKDKEIIDLITERSQELPPAFIYVLSRRLFKSNPELAMEWFAVAMFRARYDALRCLDKTAGQGIMTLYRLAAEVGEYANKHKSEFSKVALKALSREDLIASKVSPLWICVNGIKAFNQSLSGKSINDKDWFIPKSEWPKVKEKVLLSLTEYLKQLNIEQIDPVPRSNDGFKIAHYSKGNGTLKYAWLNNSKLIVEQERDGAAFGKSRDLSVWYPKTGKIVERAVEGTLLWCAGQDKIMFETERVTLPNGKHKMSYQYGSLDDTVKLSFQTNNHYPSAIQKIGWSRGRGRPENIRQSPFDCRYVSSNLLTKTYGDYWIPLKRGDGFLAFKTTNVPIRGNETTLFHTYKADADPTPVAIKSGAIAPDCISYSDSEEGYFLFPCRIRQKNREEFKQLKCIPYWWVRPREGGVKIEEKCAPVDSVTKNIPIMLPSEKGLLRIIRERRTAHGPKIGGVFLTDKTGKTSKIFDAWTWDVSMAPDGCQLAIQHFTKSSEKLQFNLSVINVCSAT